MKVNDMGRVFIIVQYQGLAGQSLATFYFVRAIQPNKPNSGMFEH